MSRYRSTRRPRIAAAAGSPEPRIWGLFLAAGDAGRYLKTGYRASLHAGFYRSPTLSMGLGTGIIYFQAEGFAAEATGFIVPLLPELRYILAGGEGIRTGVHGGVGGALFVVSSEARSGQLKVVPAAEAGMIAEFAMQGITLQLILDITLFFENSNAFIWLFAAAWAKIQIGIGKECAGIH